jgi:peptidoglycan hydrolase-like protein with peptidoglycan-binding domain
VKRRASGLGVFVALTLVAPLIVAGVLVWRSVSVSPLESAASARATVLAVESATRSGEANVAITVRTADAFQPRADVSGRLTSMKVDVGGEVTGNEVVATVDGADLVAYQAAEPIWQDVSVSSPAPVIAAAQAFLRGTGHFTARVDGKFGAATRVAIVAFNRDHGYGKDNQVLSIASLVWIGPTPVRVAKLDLRAGDPVSPGDALLTTDAGLVGIAVKEPPALVKGATYVFEYGGTTTAYVPGSGLITEPKAVAAIVRAIGDQTESAGTLHLAEPITVGTVPSSAVVTGASGSMCIFPDATGAPVKVTPLSGSMGTVDLDKAMIGTKVLVNPREVRKDLSCG